MVSAGATQETYTSPDAPTAATSAANAPTAHRRVAHRQVYTPPPIVAQAAPAATVFAAPVKAAVSTQKAAQTLTLSSLALRQTASAAYNSTGFNFHFGGYGQTDFGA